MKAQSSMELMISIAILLFVFGMILLSASSRNLESAEIKNILEKKEVCRAFSNLVYSVHKNGDGTEANMITKYAITLTHNGSIYIENIANITETRIAILASEAGQSSQNFYDIATANLNPDWYKICFNDIGSGSGCQYESPNGMEQATWDSITQTLDDLVKDIDNYDVIYLEDSTIQFAAEYGGETYKEIIENWVSDGNSLIFSEHLMCREQCPWWDYDYGPTSYRCNPPGCNYDVWDFADIRIHELGGGYYGDDTIVIRDDPMFALDVNDMFDFEENSFIEDNGAEDFTIIAEYTAAAVNPADYDPAIVHWRYGSGHIYYFGDFQVTPLQQEEFSQVISTLIEKVYEIHTTGKVALCVVPIKTGFFQVTGNITISNVDGEIIVTNRSVIT